MLVRWIGIWIGIGVFAAGLLGGCGETPREPGPMRVVVSIAPLEGVVRGVAPEDAEVSTLIPTGANPHGYQPRPSDVRALERADLIVVVGLGNEGGLGRYVRGLQDRGTRVVTFADVVGIGGDDHHHHGHDHDHAHDDAEADAHLWLDADLMVELVGAVEVALAEVAKEIGSDASGFVERAAGVRDQIQLVDAKVRASLTPYAGARLVTHHNAFARFAQRYGIEIAEVMRPVDGAEPTPGEIGAVRAALSAGDVRGVFTEPQYDGRELTRIAAEMGIPSGQLDPLGSGDWGAMMWANAEELIRVFELGG